MLRNLYGLHAPARLLMERKIVAAVRSCDRDTLSANSTCAQNPHMPGMGRSNIHMDILMGRDETLDPADFFLGWSVIVSCSDAANPAVRNGAGLASESSLGNGEQVAHVELNLVVDCMHMFAKLVSVRSWQAQAGRSPPCRHRQRPILLILWCNPGHQSQSLLSSPVLCRCLITISGCSRTRFSTFSWKGMCPR